MPSVRIRLFPVILSLVLLFIAVPKVNGYSVLTHETIVDTVWDDHLEKLLRRRFPDATAEALRTAHAYAYGGCIVHDMGYYPLGSHFFTDVIHYVRSGDFVEALLRESRDINEYAFALGALAHYAADNNGHRLAINRVVPLLYEKLSRKYGSEVTYADDPSAHIKTEFGFDVVQVAKGRYSSDAYRKFIGFEVAKPLLERAFRATYGLELKDVFENLDLGIGTYRKAVSSTIPKMTRVAWELKKDEIEKDVPGITREKFLYNLSRASYEQEWGKQYTEPGFGTRFLAFIFRIVPKIGPLRVFRFHAPTPEAEKLFMESFNVSVERYRALIAAESSGRTQLANVNMDLGEPATAGKYKLSDETYAKLVDRLAESNFAGVSSELRRDILDFYKGGEVEILAKAKKKKLAKLRQQLEVLKSSD
jgi:hypothetical protein